jgi:outer membrane lipoprotein
LDQVNHEVTFDQLKKDASPHQGKRVILGGSVLQAWRLKDQTRLEILQLPLDDSLEPIPNSTASEGRFLAFQKDFLDPAILPPGTPVTIVGDVSSSTTQPLDEMDYSYPTLEIRYLKTWDQGGRYARSRGYPLSTLDGEAYWGSTYSYGLGYGYPYYYPYPYRPFPYFFRRPSPSRPPSPPPPQAGQFRPPSGPSPLPPQFRKRR